MWYTLKTKVNKPNSSMFKKKKEVEAKQILYCRMIKTEFYSLKTRLRKCNTVFLNRFNLRNEQNSSGL